MASLCVRVKGAGKEEQPEAPMAREGAGCNECNEPAQL